MDKFIAFELPLNKKILNIFIHQILILITYLADLLLMLLFKFDGVVKNNLVLYSNFSELKRSNLNELHNPKFDFLS
ncbi:hypothetical protein BpHYR1_051204 [Brachionus plicatilis]|uniref:Uncharacterized protein n=1 Tax=Brachionus plicatilis TaxID=10195 RepID=A0A3M7S4C5_BRAPC|nr:hypothetical protein BpHYR1_051204 [Brachionus plicatilis]